MLNCAGFPRQKLYELVQEIAERYCLVTDPMQAKHETRLSYTQVLFPEDKTEFEMLKEKACKNDRPPIVWRNKKVKERASRYKPWSPSESNAINPESIRYIEADDVNWFLEREMIVVPRDFEAVERLERLKKTQQARMIWNFAERPQDIKYSNEFWQNILICQ